jgi:DNA repair exonuclease SbcCD ATPase subunit
MQLEALLRVELSYFMPFDGKVIWDIAQDAAILINGKVDDTDSSNESGKSSLFEAIYWCWTGDTIKDILASEVVHLGQTKTYVTTVCKFSAGSYTITRSWSKSLKYVTITDPNGIKKTFHDSKDGTVAILELLGIGKEMLSLIGFFGKKFTTFSRLKPGERADLIDLLAQGQEWDRSSQRANALAKQLQQKANFVQSSIAPLLAQVQQARDSRETNQIQEQVRLEHIANIRESQQAEKTMHEKSIVLYTAQQQTGTDKIQTLTEDKQIAQKEKDRILQVTKEAREIQEKQQTTKQSLIGTLTRLQTQKDYKQREYEQIPEKQEYKEVSIDEMLALVKELRTQIDTCNLEITEQTIIPTLSEIIAATTLKITRQQKAITTAEALLTALETQYSNEEEVKPNICVYCGSVLTDKEKKQVAEKRLALYTEIAEKASAVLALQGTLQEIQAELSEQVKNLHAAEEYEREQVETIQECTVMQEELTTQIQKRYLERDLYELLHAIDREQKQFNLVSEELLTTQTNLKEHSTDLTQLDELIEEYGAGLQIQNNELRATAQKLQTTTEQINKIDLLLAALEADKELTAIRMRIVEASASERSAEQQLEPMSKRHKLILAEYTKVEYWIKGFKSIRFARMLTITKQLAKYVTALAQNLGLRCKHITIEPWKETKSTTRAVINVSIVKEEGTLSIGACSEGADQRLNLAFFFAIGKLITAITGVHIPFRVLDEPLAGLDDEGKLRAFNVITQMPGISQKFVTEHDSAFKDRFTEVITVHNVNEYATII